MPRLRLSRPADRAEGRPRAGPEEARDVARRLPPRVPRVRRAIHRRAARRLQAARRPRRLGAALPDDGPRLSGGDRARPRPFCRARPRLQGQEAGLLVPPRPHGARRGRGRVRQPHLARRSTSSSRSRPTTAAELARGSPRSPERRSPFSSGRPRRGRSPRTWASRFTRTWTTRRDRARRRAGAHPWPKRLRRLVADVNAAGSFGRAPRGADQGRSARASVSAIRCTRATRSACSRRLRHARCGHRRRAHGARSRRGRLRLTGVKLTASIFTHRSGRAGRSLDTVEMFTGQEVFDANPECH